MNDLIPSIIIGDCAEAMASMKGGSVDLIATDPPFCTGRDFGAYRDAWAWDSKSDGEYEVLPPVVQIAVSTTKRLHSESMAAFCCFLATRVLAMHRVLKPTGSLFIHCDTTANGYIRLVLDAIFGPKNMINEIAWCYKSQSQAKKWFPKKHDTIFWYSKSKDWYTNLDAVRVPYKNDKAPLRRNDTERNRGGSGKWKEGDVDEMAARYAKGKIPEDWWEMTFGPNNPERTGYPTQKPIALYQRIIEASCPEGGWVLDPFCGSGTTLVAAHALGRRAIGIDINEESKRLLERRLKDVG